MKNSDNTQSLWECTSDELFALAECRKQRIAEVLGQKDNADPQDAVPVNNISQWHETF